MVHGAARARAEELGMHSLTDLGAADVVGLEQALAALLAAYLMSQAIGAVYAWTHKGLPHSRSFVHALVVGGIVAAMLMLAIGNSPRAASASWGRSRSSATAPICAIRST
jgi:hypothetical protein